MTNKRKYERIATAPLRVSGSTTINSYASYLKHHKRYLSSGIDPISKETVSKLIASRKEKETKFRSEVDLLPPLDVKPLWERNVDGSYSLLKARPISVYKLRYLLECMDQQQIISRRIRKKIERAVKSDDLDTCLAVFVKLQKLVGTGSKMSSLMAVFRRKFAAAISVPYGAADALWTPSEWESILQSEAQVVKENKSDNELLADDIRRSQLTHFEILAVRNRMAKRASKARGLRGIVKNFSFATLSPIQAGVWADASFELDEVEDKDKIKQYRSTYVQNIKGALIREVQKLSEDDLKSTTLNDLFQIIEGELQDMLPKELSEV